MVASGMWYRGCSCFARIGLSPAKTSLLLGKGQLTNKACRNHKQVTSSLLSTSCIALQGIDQGKKQTSPGPAPHFKRNLETKKGNQEATTDTVDYLLPHPIWSKDEVQSVQVTHKEPEKRSDKLAYYAVQMTRFGFDTFSGFSFGIRTEAKWLRRIIFLETVAGVPGMVGGMLRHLRSLRRMERDHGWIHTLLEEAENERMHLMTALELKKPSKFFTLAVLGAQGVFVNIFFIAYLISPCFCHRFVGYLEEEAVKTYTMLIQEIDDGTMGEWQNKTAPDIATKYWKLQIEKFPRDTGLRSRYEKAVKVCKDERFNRRVSECDIDMLQKLSIELNPRCPLGTKNWKQLGCYLKVPNKVLSNYEKLEDPLASVLQHADASEALTLAAFLPKLKQVENHTALNIVVEYILKELILDKETNVGEKETPFYNV